MNILYKDVYSLNEFKYNKSYYIDEFGKEITHSINDEPALVHYNGSLTWYNHGLEHRAAGPSYIEYNSDGLHYHFYYEWALNGKSIGIFSELNNKNYSNEKFLKYIKYLPFQ